MEDGRTATASMAGVSSRLSALCAKIQDLQEPGTDMALRRVSMACICIAMHDLGNAAAAPSASSKRTTRTRKCPPMAPMSTSQFVVEEELGYGHSGYVEKVRHRTTGKTFAMKTLYVDEDDEEEEASISNLRVLREACFMASCRGHPSLARLYAVCRNPVTKRYCLVTELVGPSLDMVLTQQGENPLPEHEVRRMMRQILSGAKAMHDRGIVHRNIEPENVLVGGAGGHDIIVKIGGFGQATSMSEKDVRYRSLIRYMAPEVLLLGRGALKSELVDSWSIGCLMAELLTGKELFAVTDLEDEGYEPDRLHKIFDVLGVPGKNTIKDMKPQDHDLVVEVRRRGTRRHDSKLRKLVPREALSDDGFMVLQGLLACNPKKRLTAGAALQLPWFANDDSPVLRPRLFTWSMATVMALLLFFVVFVCVGRR